MTLFTHLLDDIPPNNTILCESMSDSSTSWNHVMRGFPLLATPYGRATLTWISYITIEKFCNQDRLSFISSVSFFSPNSITHLSFWRLKFENICNFSFYVLCSRSVIFLELIFIKWGYQILLFLKIFNWINCSLWSFFGL